MDLDDASQQMVDAGLDGPGADAMARISWQGPTPVLEINSPSYETDPTLSRDALEVFFVSYRPGGPGNADIFRAARTSVTSAFSNVTLVSELSTTDFDDAPELASDDLTIYFGRNGAIMRAVRANRMSPFSMPVIDTGLSSSNARNPAVSWDALNAGVTVGVSGSGNNIVMYSRADSGQPWGGQQSADELNTVMNEGGLSFDATALEIYFHTDRPGASGLDIYYARRFSVVQPFSLPENVAELNSSGSDGDPDISSDGRMMVFARDGDIYMSTR